MASKPAKKSVPSAGKIAAVVIKRMALSDLKPHPRNDQIRRHPEPGTPRWETLKKSLDNDYFDPIVFNTRNGYIVSGHLRLKILMAEGYTHADVSLVDYDEQTHLARLIAANRDIGEDIMAGIADIMLELDTGDMDMALTGFDTSAIEKMMTNMPPDGKEPLIPEMYGVMITAQTEGEQTELLERFMKEGLTCRAVQSY